MDKFYYNSDEFRLKNWNILDSPHITKVYEKNQIIYMQGDKSDTLYYIKSGKVEIFLLSSGGLEKNITVFGQGSLFGKSSFFGKVSRTSSARAAEKTELVTIDRKTFMKIMQDNPQFIMDMMEYLSKTIRMLSDQVHIMTFDQADKRVAEFLSNAYRNSINKPYIHFTHEDICEHIGATRVTVSKILGKFSGDGWIETGYKKIKIINLESIINYGAND